MSKEYKLSKLSDELEFVSELLHGFDRAIESIGPSISLDVGRFLVKSQYLEKALKTLYSLMCYHFSLFPTKYRLSKRTKKLTLGDLLGELERFRPRKFSDILDYGSLISNLKEFIVIRNQYTHNIFDKRKDINSLKIELEHANKLLDRLLKQVIETSEELISYERRHEND